MSVKREDVKCEIASAGLPASKGRKGPTRGYRTGPIAFYLILFNIITLNSLAPSVSAQPTQEEVFKSIGDTVNEPVDSSRALAVAAGIGGAVVLLVAVGQWRKREAKPKSLNHPGKLLKEVLRSVPLKGAEVRQIRSLAQDYRPPGGGRIESPLTLLLCPSLLSDAAKQSRGKADLPVVAGLVRRLVGKRREG